MGFILQERTPEETLKSVKSQIQFEINRIKMDLDFMLNDVGVQDFDCLKRHVLNIHEEAEGIGKLADHAKELRQDIGKAQELKDLRKRADSGEVLFNQALDLKTLEASKLWIDNLTPEQVKQVLAFVAVN